MVFGYNYLSRGRDRDTVVKSQDTPSSAPAFVIRATSPLFTLNRLSTFCCLIGRPLSAVPHRTTSSAVSPTGSPIESHLPIPIALPGHGFQRKNHCVQF